MDYAKHLIERIAAAPEDDRVGVLANELLREFHRGYALDDLRQMLINKDEGRVAVAVWITSELGIKCRPLLGDVLPLLSHPKKGIRFDALDCMFWTLPQNGCDLAKAVSLLDDPDAGIRWKVLDILFRFSRDQLEAAYLCERAEVLASSHRDGLRWLLSSDAQVSRLVESAVNGPDPVMRKYGVVAAARLREQDKGPLQHALAVADPDVRKFASSLLGS